MGIDSDVVFGWMLLPDAINPTLFSTPGMVVWQNEGLAVAQRQNESAAM
jgi:hypothetical protein